MEGKGGGVHGYDHHLNGDLMVYSGVQRGWYEALELPTGFPRARRYI
jgi:hypothetical protein